MGEKAETSKVIKVKFPDEYPNKELEGKNAEFDVKIIDIDEVLNTSSLLESLLKNLKKLVSKP